jgi:hypothetical protein
MWLRVTHIATEDLGTNGFDGQDGSTESAAQFGRTGGSATQIMSSLYCSILVGLFFSVYCSGSPLKFDLGHHGGDLGDKEPVSKGGRRGGWATIPSQGGAVVAGEEPSTIILTRSGSWDF